VSFPRLEQSAAGKTGGPGEQPPVPPEDNGIVLAGSHGETVLMIRSSGGALLGSFILREGLNSRAGILANEQIRTQARELYLWEQGSSAGLALLSGPWAAEDFLFSQTAAEPR
jgi:hypothetical protein